MVHASHKGYNGHEKIGDYSIDQLKAIVNAEGDRLAHTLARTNPKYFDLFLANEEVLAIANDKNISVAHILSKDQGCAGKLLDMPKVLRYADCDGWTVAHNVARHKRSKIKKLYKIEEILKLADNTGWTVKNELELNERHWREQREGKESPFAYMRRTDSNL